MVWLVYRLLTIVPKRLSMNIAIAYVYSCNIKHVIIIRYIYWLTCKRNFNTVTTTYT